MIRTKIVATLGPACASEEALARLFEAGADVCRLNFSHGELAQHRQMLDLIRAAAKKHDHPIAVLGDLCGPKIRLGKVADVDNTGGMPIDVGDELIIQRASIVGGNHRVSTTYPQLIDDVEVGHRILIEDGLIRLICTEKNYNELRCQCTIAGVLKSAKGINLPNTRVRVPSITDKDWACADWAIDNGLDFLALSFVRKADDIALLRQHLMNRSSRIHIIAKIEKAEALEEIDAIIEACDGLMVARGDLGVEMDVAQVPIIQKDLIRRCQVAAKPVIVATQMLQSMIEQASPTRAEVSDVANAIFDGADAVMLSGETSVGKFPVGAVHTMAHVAEVTEDYLASAAVAAPEPLMKLKTMPISAGIGRGVWQIAQDLRPRLVVVWSQTGATARIFSKNRFPIPIVAISSDPLALRQMALLFGVVAQEMPAPREMGHFVELADRLIRQRGFASTGDRVVLVAGSSLGTPGTMNGIILHTVGQQWQAVPPSAAAGHQAMESG